MIRSGLDVARTIKHASATTGGPIEVKATRWCARERQARWIVDECKAAFPSLAGGWLAVSAPVAIKAVEIVAGHHGVAIETDAQLRERAEATVRAVELQLVEMKSAGKLKGLGRKYREYRLARTAEEDVAQSWTVWFANYKADLIRVAAEISDQQGARVLFGGASLQVR